MWPAISVFAVLMAALLIWGAARGLGGWIYRSIAALILLLILCNPSLQIDERSGRADQLLLLLDRTASQTFGGRSQMTSDAAAELRQRIAGFEDVEIIAAEVGESGTGRDSGTFLLQALQRQMRLIEPDRFAGAIVISDGLAHDWDSDIELPSPTHLLISGERGDFDREMVVSHASPFALVGEKARITARILDAGDVPDGGEPVALTATAGGEFLAGQSVVPGEILQFEIPIDMPGLNRIEFATPPVPGELTGINNVAGTTIHGVRDNLRVLLLSGFPNPGQRSWRNVLKSDSEVELIHFTILRNPDNRDPTPSAELALIPFPIQELFVEQLQSFDVVILDQFVRRGLIPPHYFFLLRRYVEQGGALLVVAGPELTDENSLFDTAVGDILPAAPTGELIERGFKPLVTETGARHPVTARLAQSLNGEWGRWFRQIGLSHGGGGSVIMSGIDDRPLLILDRVGEGRVAMLASDQAWLWQRGVDGGGPLPELLRLLVHWMMRQPGLEEEALTLVEDGGGLQLRRRTLAGESGGFSLESPSGRRFDLPADQLSPGLYGAAISAAEAGVWRVAQGDLEQSILKQPAAPKEYRGVLATDRYLRSRVQSTGGGVFHLQEGVPELRRVREGATAAGRSWMGIARREAFDLTSVALYPLLPALLAALLVIGAAAAAWYREGRH